VINIPRSRLKVIARATTYVAISIKPGDRRIIHKLSTIEVVIFSLNDERAVGGKGVENKVVGRAFARGIEDHDSYIVNTVASQWPGVLHKEIGFVSAHEGIGYFRQSQERGGDLGAIRVNGKEVGIDLRRTTEGGDVKSNIAAICRWLIKQGLWRWVHIDHLGRSGKPDRGGGSWG